MRQGEKQGVRRNETWSAIGSETESETRYKIWSETRGETGSETRSETESETGSEKCTIKHGVSEMLSNMTHIYGNMYLCKIF